MTRTYQEAKRIGLDIDAAMKAAYELGRLETLAIEPDSALAKARRQLDCLLRAHRHVLAMVMAEVAFVDRLTLWDTIRLLPRNDEGLAMVRKLREIWERDLGGGLPKHRPQGVCDGAAKRIRTKRRQQALERTWEGVGADG